MIQFHKLPMRLFAAFGLGSLISFPAFAEITLDGTLGPSGALTGPSYQIPASVGEQVGSNLFHSFGVFNINTGESATFTGPNGIENVLGRVTDGESSNIDGELNSDIPGANLYLINPAGIMFGPNAQLNVDGSFHATTADYVRLGQDGVFSATDPETSTLTVAPPSAFGFLDNNPAPISVQAGTPDKPFAVPPRETFSIVGGNIRVAGGYIFAPSGRINIAGVASPGEVDITDRGLKVDSFERLGNIEISQKAAIDASGEGGGSIFIRGGNLMLNNSGVESFTRDMNGKIIDVRVNGNLVIHNSLTGGVSTGAGRSGDVVLIADNLVVSGNSKVIAGGKLGSSGDILINVGHAVLTGAGDIIASSLGKGAAGDITLTASEGIVINGQTSAIQSVALGSGPGGNITVITDGTLMMNYGDITAGTAGAADAGTVTVQARNMTLTNAAQIDTVSGGFFGDSQNGTGRGGDINVTVTGMLSISGTLQGAPSALLASAETGQGDAGDIYVSAGNLVISDGGAIASQTRLGAKGNAGDLTINVETLNLRDGGSIAANTIGPGNGGDINVIAREGILISGRNAIDRSGIFSGSLDSGDSGFAGNITVITDGALVMNGGGIVAETAGQGDGGKIIVKALNVTLANGAAVRSTTSGAGSGGELIVIVKDTLSLSGADEQGFTSELDTGAFSEGNAGDISVTAGKLNISGGVISTSSDAKGDAGSIVIRVTDNARLINGLIAALASQTDGGNITLTANSVQLTQGSDVSSSVFGSPNTTGGNVTINGGSLVLLNGSKVTASAVQGKGGFITVNSDAFLHDAGSVRDVLNASARTRGNDGTVTVNSPDTDIAGSITRLPISFLNAAALLSQRCAARSAEDTSSFVIIGRGGVPRGPDDWSISSYVSGASGARKVISGGIESASESAKGKATPRIAMLRLSCARQP